MKVGTGKNPCCQKKENRVFISGDRMKNLTMCKVCGSRHWYMFAEPGKIGLQMAPR